MDILPYGGNHGHSTNKWFALKKPAELTNSTRRHLENLPTGKLVPSPAPATEPETGVVLPLVLVGSDFFFPEDERDYSHFIQSETWATRNKGQMG